MPHQHHAGHQHHQLEKRENQGTVVQYVYETAAKTFEGPVAGYSTVNAAAAASTPDSASSNANANSNTNSNSKPDSQQQDQQAAQQSAAAAAASSSSVAAELAQASSTAAAAAEASKKLAAVATQQTQKADTLLQATVQATSTADKTVAAAKETPTGTTLESTPTPTIAAATSSSPSVATTPTSSFIVATESASSSRSSNTAAPSKGSSGGMTGGAKAGLAIGILFIIGLLAAGLFLCYRRRKKHESEAYRKTDNEKSPYAGGLARAQSTTSIRTTANAPRLSLRPVTQFLPDLAARGKAANAVGGAAGGAAMASKDHNDPGNPFGNHAEVAHPPQASFENEKSALPIQANAEDPFADTAVLSRTDRSLDPAADVPAPLRVKTPTPETVAAAGAGIIGVGTGAVVGANIAGRHNAPKPLNLSSNRSVSPAGASPAVSEFSQKSVSTGALANGPPPSNVHRIQLDFKPSMEDELSLRAGQLVRLLHEYDDGWALCIRLDRSQQGVAPRTCLSARPVKPRPPPGPRGPPPGMMGPGQHRPSSPANGRGSPGPRGRASRPIGPGQNGSQQRSMSPGPYGGGPQRPANIPPPGAKPRRKSTSDPRERRNSPPGPSPMNPNVQRVPMQLQAVTSPDEALSPSPSQTMARKPVPGQAM